MGGRSRAAAQMLAGQGFEEVYNLKGGFKAWTGEAAVGSVEMGVSHLPADAEPADVLQLAYAMEVGLAEFYRSLAAGGSDEAVDALLSRLAGMEEGHKQLVFRLYQRVDPDVPDAAALESRIESRILEGGFTTEAFLETNREAWKARDGVIEVAMALEAQALDLYMRLAQRAAHRESGDVLQELADQEKSHLEILGRLMDTAP